MTVKQVISLLILNSIFSWNETDRKYCGKSRSVIILEIYEMEVDFEMYGRTVHTHHRFKITLSNTDQAHNKISLNHYV
jgi:hypothetical protein